VYLCSYHKNQREENDCDEHWSKTVDEPADPVDSVAEAHDPHCLLQSSLLLVDNTLDDHRTGVNPGQSHEERKGPGDGQNEPAKNAIINFLPSKK